MADTVIMGTHRPRQFAGGVFFLIGVPITLLLGLMAFAGHSDVSDLLVLLIGPLLLAFGLWLAFPRHPPTAKLTISDQSITIMRANRVVPLDALTRVKQRRPFLANYSQLMFCTTDEEFPFDVAHVTQDARDIINLISIRLERQGKSLHQTRTDVAGALSGIWEVQNSVPFADTPAHAKIAHGREQNQSDSPKR